jgi:predicted transcriptional regulator
MEYKSLRITELMKTTKAGQLMRTRFTMVYEDDGYDKLIQLFKEAGEKNFLVFTRENDVIGSVPELFIRDVMKKGNYGCKVKDLMSQTYGIYPAHTTLEFLMMAMKDKGLAIAGIEEDQIITGVIDRQMIQDFIILKSS